MRLAAIAMLAAVPWVVFTLLLRFVVSMEGWPIGLVGTLSRMVTLPLLGAWVLGTGRGWRRLLPHGTAGWILVMGAFSLIINLCWFGSVQWTTATNVSMLFRTDLVFVVLIGMVLGIERVGRAQLAVLPVMLLGLALVTEIQNFDLGGHLLGDLMAVCAAFGLAANAFVIRHIMRVMDEEAVALYNHAISTLGFVAVGVIGGGFSRTSELLHQPKPLFLVVVLGVIATVALPLYYVALRRMSVWKLRTFMLSVPVITVSVEWPLWGASLTGLQCLGGLIVLAGLAALIRIESRQDATGNQSATDDTTSDNTGRESLEAPPNSTDKTKNSCLAASSQDN
jgi:drug/metabolite transporter (DMT)-like permease